MSLDLLIKNVSVVQPGGDGAEDLDIAIDNGQWKLADMNVLQEERL